MQLITSTTSRSPTQSIGQTVATFCSFLTITNWRFLPFKLLHHREAMTGWI